MKEHNKHSLNNETWLKIVKYASSNRNDSDSQTKLLSQLLGKKDISIVIDYIIGTEHAHKWIHSKIPALGFLTPIECLENEATLQQLKMTLMQMY